MKLYKRDYSRLTADEQAKLQSLKKQEIVDMMGVKPIRKSLFRNYPKAARHFLQWFPNHYLDTVELKDEARLRTQVQSFEGLLDSAGASERGILKFIAEHEAYFIIGSLLWTHFDFGHHGAFLFREFPLGASHQVDYMLVGGGSGGWRFVFIELESPSSGAIMGNGDPGLSFRKGLGQVRDWNKWLDANFHHLKEVFDKYKTGGKIGEGLPDEFIELDKSRLHFVVVAGKRKDFKDKTYTLRRNLQRENTWLLHYDNLVDSARAVIGKKNY